MAELINKWDVVSKLITLENEYQFFKGSADALDAEKMYRRICEMEIEIGKTPGAKWIPVTERLPDKFGEYIVAIKTIDTAVYSDYADYDPFRQQWTTGLFFDIGSVVTHWMHLPQPPKGGMTDGNA